MSFNEGGQKNTDFTSKPRSPRFTLAYFQKNGMTTNLVMSICLLLIGIQNIPMFLGILVNYA